MCSIRFYLSERFRLRFEDAGLEEMMEEQEGAEGAETIVDEVYAVKPAENNNAIATDTSKPPPMSDIDAQLQGGIIRTLDGEIAGDEFAQDAVNYQILLGKIDVLLDKLKLDA